MPRARHLEALKLIEAREWQIVSRGGEQMNAAAIKLVCIWERNTQAGNDNEMAVQIIDNSWSEVK